MKKIFLLITILAVVKPLFAQLPDFTQTDCNGVEHHLYADLQAGNAVVLDFSAVWCSPCAQAEPIFVQLYNDLSQGQCRVKQYLMLFDGLVPGGGSDCTIGNNYAKKFNINFPVLTNIGTWTSGLTGQFFNLYDQINNVGVNENGIPMFLIILPNTIDPANSTVKSIVGVYPNLLQMFKDSLALGGYDPSIKFSGNFCAQPFNATLTSAFDLPNIWSTGETTQSIQVNQGGTYTVTKDGCQASKYVEFTLAGTAHSSTSSICQGGLFTLSYDIPQGTGGILTWQSLEGQNVWQDLAPADLGDIVATAIDPPGTVYTFRVKAVNTSSPDSCTQYSNEIQLTVNGNSPTVVEGAATASTSQVCFGSDYTVQYTGGIANSFWEYYDDNTGQWQYFSVADDQPLSIYADQAFSNINGLPGMKLRVKSPQGDCFAVSNTLEIVYAPLPSAPQIVGPDYTCSGAGSLTLQLGASYNSVLWSTGATSNAIIVSPTQSTTYSVTVTGNNGCSNSARHYVYVVPAYSPIITANTSSICPGGAVTLSFGGLNANTPCTNAPLGKNPAAAYTPGCTGDIELITEFAHLGEYSVVNVVAGNYYYFLTANYENYPYVTTIGSTDSTQVFTSGTDFVLWKASFTGQVRMYSTSTGCVTDNNTYVRAVACIPDVSLLGGTFLWSSGATTPSTVVNPAATTSYSLTYTDGFYHCANTGSKQVVVGIGSANETTSLITTSSAQLNWTSTYNPDQWQLQYKGIAPGDKWVDVPLQAGTIRSYSVSGLKAAQSYNWHIRAKCGKSWTAYSDAVTFKTLAKTGTITTRATDANNQLQLAEGLSIEVSPNPAANSFNVVVNSDDMSSLVVVQVFDALGRLVDTRKTSANSTIKIGEMYKPGSYYIRTVQGERHKEITVIKVGN